MILEILKFLTEAPEKITQGVVFSLRNLYALLLSILLYRWLYDKVGNGQLTEWEVWKDWLVSGRVLIWIFLFVLAYKLLFDVVWAITTLPLEWLARRPWKPLPVNKDMLTATLRALSGLTLISYDQKTERLKATRNTASLIEFLEGLEAKDEGREEPEPILGTYLQMWHLFALFAAFYFFTGVKESGHWFLSILIILFLLVIPMGYLAGMRLFNLLIDKRADILFLVRGMEFDGKVESALKKQGCLVNEHISADGKTYWRTFWYKQQIYYFNLCWIRGAFTVGVLDEIILAKVHGDRRVVLFTNGDIGPGLKAKVSALEGRLQVVQVKSEGDLSAILEVAFPNERPTRLIF